MNAAILEVVDIEHLATVGRRVRAEVREVTGGAGRRPDVTDDPDRNPSDLGALVVIV